MIPLASKTLSPEVQQVLDELQKEINSESTFEEKVNKAQALWKSKGGKKGKDAFEIISKKLYDMCVYVGVCNYCEQSEANDIEHIYAKSFFPEHTFDWTNYLLACKQCNSGYKLDKCDVLNDNGDIVNIKRGDKPTYNTIAFINPRTENPNNFIIINPLSYTFELLPDLNNKDKNKAESTLKILELNGRDTLLEGRKSAGRHYYEMMDRLRLILNAHTIEELENALTPYDSRFDFTQPLEYIKNTIIDSYKRYISSYQHPSVWYSIKTIESKTNPKWKLLFQQIPDALNW